jgi:hypothetical protein
MLEIETVLMLRALWGEVAGIGLDAPPYEMTLRRARGARERWEIEVYEAADPGLEDRVFRGRFRTEELVPVVRILANLVTQETGPEAWPVILEAELAI